MVHLLQRTLVQVGSTSQAINIKRRKIAWGRINPGMKTLAKETYDNRKASFLGQAFLRKHQRRLTRPLLRSSMMGPTHKRDQLRMIPRISAIFCSKAPSKGKQHKFKLFHSNPKKNYQNKKQKSAQHPQK